MNDEIIQSIRLGAFNSILYWSKNIETAKDFAQETVCRILEKGVNPTFTSLDKSAAFGAVCAYRIWIDDKRKRRCPCLALIPEMTSIEDETDRSIYGITDEELYKAVNNLPKHNREYVLKVLFENKTNKERAEETGENVNTLMSRSRYTKKRLKKLLS